ncbi:uncharacterized protein METZ01_LOCUS270709 [marine metagenome]|jgi:hypothetical protein|uniref:Uncharacterized protein n=1 Tax=marine metagenome TaxID=408172 RepID=A0A382K203_9ZZZZ|tara:strand:- start:241 stop:357 length:117 start_codon:yes stop_codon:yes gene_type:complete
MDYYSKEFSKPTIEKNLIGFSDSDRSELLGSVDRVGAD